MNSSKFSRQRRSTTLRYRSLALCFTQAAISVNCWKARRVTSSNCLKKSCGTIATRESKFYFLTLAYAGFEVQARFDIRGVRSVNQLNAEHMGQNMIETLEHMVLERQTNL